MAHESSWFDTWHELDTLRGLVDTACRTDVGSALQRDILSLSFASETLVGFYKDQLLSVVALSRTLRPF